MSDSEAGWFLDGCWRICEAAPGRRDDAFRTPVLATAHPVLGAQARTVVLRACDPGAATFDLHSDARAAKVEAIGSDPRAALLFWDAERRLQVRVEGRADLFDAASAQGRGVFETLGDGARRAYRHRPDPGAAIEAADAYEDGAGQGEDPARRFFRLVRLRAERFEALDLSGGRQARALWTGAGGAGWIVP